MKQKVSPVLRAALVIMILLFTAVLSLPYALDFLEDVLETIDRRSIQRGYEMLSAAVIDPSFQDTGTRFHTNLVQLADKTVLRDDDGNYVTAFRIRQREDGWSSIQSGTVSIGDQDFDGIGLIGMQYLWISMNEDGKVTGFGMQP